MVPQEIATVIYSNLYLTDDSHFLLYVPPILLELALYPIYTAGLIFYIASVITDKKIDVKTSLLLGIKNWGQLLTLIIILDLLVTVGLLLLIVPGIYLAVRYFFSEIELLLNNQRPIKAMEQSWALSKAHFSTIFRGLIVITAILLTPYIFLYLAIGEYLKESHLVGSAVDLVYGVLGSLYTIFAFRMYQVVR